LKVSIDILSIHDIIEMTSGRRNRMLIEYIQKALERARYKVLEDGTWFAEVPGFEGVWANADTVEECRHELMEVLEEWLILKIRDRDPIPEIEGVTIRVKEVIAA
jgi:predicted RNase H-like HicB family nuclease